MRRALGVIAAVASIVLAQGQAGAQNLPPPGAYQPIPNFIGVGAGLQFRSAINDRFSGVQPVAPSITNITFANLPAEQDGEIVSCKDCRRTTPCTAGGAGAWALGTRGQWSCSTDYLEANLNANGNKVANLANATAGGDALGFGQSAGGDLAGALPNPSVQTVLGGQTPTYQNQVQPQFKSLEQPFVVASSTATNGATSCVINKPTGTAQGDALFFYVTAYTGSLIVTPPDSSWHAIHSGTNGHPDTDASYYKVAGASEASSYTFTLSTGQGGTCGLIAVRGENQTTPIDASSSFYTSGAVSSITVPAPSATQSPDLTLIFAMNNNAIATVASPSGVTLQFQSTGNSQETAGWSYTTTPTAAVLTASPSYYLIGQQIAIAPSTFGPASALINGQPSALLSAPTLSGSTLTGNTSLSGSIIGSGASASISAASVNNVLNVMAFAAKCNNSADDYLALQAAITAACTNKQALYVPPGLLCLHSKPLLAQCSLTMFGENTGQGYAYPTGALRPLNYNGPDILIEAPFATPSFSTGPPLVGSTGVSLKWDTNGEKINLRSMKQAELNGLTAITAEGWMNFPTNQGTIIASCGGLSPNQGDVLPGKGNTCAMMLYAVSAAGGGPYTRCTLNISGTVHSLMSGTGLSTGAAHFYACSWDNASGIMDLYLDGTRIAKATGITGAVKQNVTEDVTIGYVNQTGPEGQPVGGSDVNTLVDSIRISNVNRYPDAATIAVPTAKFTDDSNTIQLVNMVTDVNGFIESQSGHYTIGFADLNYNVFQRYQEPGGSTEPFDAGVNIHDLYFSGGLYCHFCTYGSKFRNLTFQYAFMGLILGGNSNEDLVENLSVLKGGVALRYGLLVTTFNGGTVRGVQIDSSDFPVVINGAARAWFSDLLLTPEANTGYTLFSTGAAPSIRGFYSDDEGQSGTPFVASMAFQGNWAPADISGVEIDSVKGGSGTGHGIIFDSGYAGTIHDASFGNDAGTSDVFINGNGAGMLSHPIVYSIQKGATATTIGMTNANAGMTLSSCGTGSFSAGAQDADFEVTATGATGCTVAFGIAYPTVPMVNCVDETTAAALKVLPSTSNVVISGLTASDKFRCSIPIQTGY